MAISHKYNLLIGGIISPFLNPDPASYWNWLPEFPTELLRLLGFTTQR